MNVDDLLKSPALKPEQLLVNRESAGEDTVGYWRFEETEFLQRLVAQRSQHPLGHCADWWGRREDGGADSSR